MSSFTHWGTNNKHWQTTEQCTDTTSMVEQTHQGDWQVAQPPEMLHNSVLLATGQTWYTTAQKSTPTPTWIAFLDTNPNMLLPIQLMDKGIQYLGVYIMGDQNTWAMEQHLWQKVQLYHALAFQCTPMNHREAGVLYQSCFIPAMAYPLPATWLPDHFFEQIYQLSTLIVLNKMGYHRNLPQCMVFAPHMISSMGLCNLWYEMEAQQRLILLDIWGLTPCLGEQFWY